MKDLDITRELRIVMDLEADALRRTRDAVDGAYAKAVRLIHSCKGKVVVTGVGKSGLIGQKIAATLSATGTPAVFLHPAEGLHGDLGVVQKGDAVIAIGKSGESEELTGLLPSLKKLGAKIIALTAKPGSTLGKAADVVLLTPIEAEACPLNLSPTCSTTAAIAVGDALAVVVMKMRGFGKDQFAVLHPGGSLGKRLTVLVSDLMRKGEDNPVIRIDRGVSEMLGVMTEKRAGAVSVVDAKGRIIGLVTDHDVRKHLGAGENVLARRIKDVMNARFTKIGPERLAMEAADIMSNRTNPFLVMPVVDKKGRAIGMIHLHDIRARGL
jgi:arabinose-5-phosphate isomerase